MTIPTLDRKRAAGLIVVSALVLALGVGALAGLRMHGTSLAETNDELSDERTLQV